MENIETTAPISPRSKLKIDDSLRCGLIVCWQHKWRLIPEDDPNRTLRKMEAYLKALCVSIAGPQGIDWVDKYLEQRETLLKRYSGKFIVWDGDVIDVADKLEDTTPSFNNYTLTHGVWPLRVQVGNEETEIVDI